MNSNKDNFSEVLIVGGGVIGLSIARELHRRGARRITVLERGKVGRESSYAAAGMLAPNAETEKADDFTKFCAESLDLYNKFAEELFGETDVNIELDRSGTVYAAFTDHDSAEIRRRYDWQKRAGLAVEFLSAEETRRAEPFVSPDVRESLFFPFDWQVENRKLLHALEKFAELNRIKIVENAEVKSLLTENGKIGGVRTVDADFSADAVVLATGAWTSLIENGGDIALPEIKPVRGQIIGFQTAKRLFERVIYSPRGYLVPRRDGRILIGATVEDAGFDKNITAAGTEFLRAVAMEISPSLASLEIAETWAGLRPLAADGLPVLGAVAAAKNLFIATAHYRNGILLAPLTAKILAERIAENKDSEYLRIFSPNRFKTAAAT